jgi:hypothetical protein
MRQQAWQQASEAGQKPRRLKMKDIVMIETSKLVRANSTARFDKPYFLKSYVSIVFSLSILIHYSSF